MASPDIIVGIDFGMTATGVAYSAAPDWPRPETIQNWPGTFRGSIADKVDTKIAYDVDSNIVGWGFAIDEANGTIDTIEEYFKLHLDPEFVDTTQDPPTTAQARMWFVDYLTCLFKTINRYLNDVVPQYQSKRVEFKFSVPTTWKNPAMIADMESLICEAGFGSTSLLHRSDISLTEAEAAAVYAAQQKYEAGQVILVCDAGGGTSDVNILKVVSSGVGMTELAPLRNVEGRAIGSTLIDFHVEKLIAERLRVVADRLPQSLDTVSCRMIKENSRFESFKCNIGDDVMDLPTLRLSIPGVPTGLNIRPHIENSHLILTKKEIEQIFDTQVSRLCELIDDQLWQLEQAQPGETITYLVLSGGFGSSLYLQKGLRQKYLHGRSFACIRDVQILRVAKPQLAVCHGLVLDRVQQLKEDRVVYKERFCRNSYGVICRVEYDPSKHSGEPTTYDPRDRKTWVLNQIDWFIRQGQKVNVREGIKQHYSLKVPLGGESQPWITQVVMSTLPANMLPTSLNKPGAHRLCQVKSRLPIEMKTKNAKWYKRSDQYSRAEFDVQVLVGAADLKFQTLDKYGLLSQDHSSIEVKWYSTSSGSKSPILDMAELSTANTSLDADTHSPAPGHSSWTTKGSQILAAAQFLRQRLPQT